MRRGVCRHCRRNDSLERLRRRRGISDAAKVASGCVDCPPGVVWPAIALDFDHRPGTQKRATIAALVTKGTDDEFHEISKCEVIWANHHRMRTAARLARPLGVAIPRPRAASR